MTASQTAMDELERYRDELKILADLLQAEATEARADALKAYHVWWDSREQRDQSIRLVRRLRKKTRGLDGGRATALRYP
ncbi:hypothetical protein [Rhizohabitans arisaemae]|uniref:hypothetical protein n=1 Tax=Rhizohabitans arisaemae TaxID=2720610 RepID=UPI0024B1C6B2|nr:hypothetical protein [Rhizohabitans arisaemae]